MARERQQEVRQPLHGHEARPHIGRSDDALPRRRGLRQDNSGLLRAAGAGRALRRRRITVLRSSPGHPLVLLTAVAHRARRHHAVHERAAAGHRAPHSP